MTEICSLVKSLALIEGWPHTLVFGHQLAKTCVVKKFSVASQMSYHLTSGKVATWSSAHLVTLETPRALWLRQAASSGTAAVAVLPHPLPSQLHGRLFRRWHSLGAGNSLEEKRRNFWPGIAVCDPGALGSAETWRYCFVSEWTPQVPTTWLPFKRGTSRLDSMALFQFTAWRSYISPS